MQGDAAVESKPYYGFGSVAWQQPPSQHPERAIPSYVLRSAVQRTRNISCACPSDFFMFTGWTCLKRVLQGSWIFQGRQLARTGRHCLDSSHFCLVRGLTTQFRLLVAESWFLSAFVQWWAFSSFESPRPQIQDIGCGSCQLSVNCGTYAIVEWFILNT